MEKYFKLTFDEYDLGKEWMNIDNLKICLYSKDHTKEELCRVEDVTEEVEKAREKAYPDAICE